MQPSFVHLRLHSEYSVVDGIVRIEDAVAAAKADGMPALALTDLSNVFGMVKFYKAARGAGVKPVIGCDVWLTNDADRDKPFRLLLLAQHHAGYLRLCRLLTQAYRCNQYRGRVELKREWFNEGSEGLIALSGAHHGDIGQALIADNAKAAATLARDWAKKFPNRFYIEVQRPGPGAMTTGAAVVPVETCVQRSLKLAAQVKLPVVATHPVQFLREDDFRAHEARVCVAEGYLLSDQRRPRLYTEQQYFLRQEEILNKFKDLPESLANSVEIAKRCNLTLELGKSKLPLFPTPNNESLDEYLKLRAHEGLRARMQTLYPMADLREEHRPRYVERLEFEIKVILQMGFPGYFLIVADFINWAKNNGVPVGPGRGSGAGSLVAYSLGITDLDPLRYNLLFERFLNPDRVSMPDFDIDFCQDGRDRVIEYVKQRYGADSVSQIATFGTMAAKGVVRDVGRVLEMPYSFCDQIAKLIPFQPGKHITLADAREMEPQLKEREKNEEEVAQLLALAEKVEGLTRNVGMHAGGVLIAPGKLTDFCPLYVADASESAISQFDKDDVEAIGLVKFDFLGLTTLTILDWAVRYVKQLDPASKLELHTIPLDDAASYKIFASANTTAIFQFESRGMRDLLKRARPDRFGDIIALVALYRPGPMELIPEFCDRKHGKRFEYPDPRVKDILAESYGIMIYQEQVMQMAQIIGGYSLGGADLLRRAMGKKKPEEMAEHRGIFGAGAAKNGLSERKADELFDLMEKFAGYGFNKSHAAAYALVAYQTAYMKAHHAAAFIAANLSAVMNDTDKVQQFHDDCCDNGLEILAPDVNSGGYRFAPVDEKCIRYGLGAIKGTGEGAINHIIEVRGQSGPFKDLFDFCHRVDNRVVNRRVVESLVRAGAFDSVDDNRAALLASVGIALEGAEQASRSANQANLFGDVEDHRPTQHLANVPRWSDLERLKQEKVALGYYLSGHPFRTYEGELRDFVPTRLDQIQPQPHPMMLAGIVVSQRIQMTRRGRMAVLVIDDSYARIELTVFNELFEEHRHWLKEDQLVVVEGKVSFDEFSQSLRISAEKLLDLQKAREQFARALKITCNGLSSGEKLRALLTPYLKGPCPVEIEYYNKQARCEVKLGEEWRVHPRDELIASLAEWLRPENVRLRYRDEQHAVV
ncbi:MAG: DNA polymerase III subunit alpha [Betaproteobacteria bacterium]|nr:DNA polymerase III subunit alpha [Betaproteobacteria bacterium]